MKPILNPLSPISPLYIGKTKTKTYSGGPTFEDFSFVFLGIVGVIILIGTILWLAIKVKEFYEKN